MKKRIKNLFIGGLIGYVGGTIGLHLSHTMDGAQIHWFLFPLAIILSAVLFEKESRDLDD